MGEPNERLQKQMAFILEADKEKFIQRQTYLTGGERKENDAEHAWHLALMTLLLSEYANREIDVLRTISMVLIHDIVEIDAGDTYAYDPVGKQTQRQRETKAADRLFGLLPEDQCRKLRDLWEEFEAEQTPEAAFAHAMDNLQPTLLNAAAGGKSWVEHATRLSSILSRHEGTRRGSETLWEFCRAQYLEPNLANGKITDDCNGLN